jgi:hypothetical protein
MHKVEDTARRLTAIRGLGARIAIDDFGRPTDPIALHVTLLTHLSANDA